MVTDFLLSVRPFQTHDKEAVEKLLFHAFGSERLSLPSYALRRGQPLDRLSWVAGSADGQILGCLRFWRVELRPCGLPSVLLGPLAVDLAYRGAGVARALVRFGLDQATDLGFDLCFVVGEPQFYRRFGFTNAAWSGLTSCAFIPTRRLQVVELRGPSLAGLQKPQILEAKADSKCFEEAYLESTSHYLKFCHVRGRISRQQHRQNDAEDECC